MVGTSAYVPFSTVAKAQQRAWLPRGIEELTWYAADPCLRHRTLLRHQIIATFSQLFSSGTNGSCSQSTTSHVRTVWSSSEHAVGNVKDFSQPRKLAGARQGGNVMNKPTVRRFPQQAGRCNAVLIGEEGKGRQCRNAVSRVERGGRQHSP